MLKITWAGWGFRKAENFIENTVLKGPVPIFNDLNASCGEGLTRSCFPVIQGILALKSQGEEYSQDGVSRGIPKG